MTHSGKNTSDRVRVGVVGLGKMGIVHSALLNIIPTAHLVGVADSDRQLGQYVNSIGLDVRFFDSAEKLVGELAPQAVFICTPSHAHESVARICWERDIDLFVEKPLAQDLAAAQRMMSGIAGRSLVLGTGYILAFFPLFQKARELLSRDLIGKIHRFRSSMYLSQVFSRRKGGWMYDEGKSGGGVVINTTSHLIYALQWFFGVPTQIYARTTRMYSDVEDSCSAIFEYPDGLTGTLDTSWSLPGYRLPGIEVIAEGERGTIELTDYFIKLHLQRGGGGFPEGWTTIHKTELETPSRFEVGGEGFYSEAETFIQSCLSRTAPPVSWKEGYEVQRIVDAIYRSANTGHAVTLV